VSVIDALAWGAGIGVLSIVFVGLRRVPWRYAGLVGVGTGTVFAALRLVMIEPSFDPALAVLVAAVGGAIATVGTERGERARVRRSEAILAGRQSALG
jgi:ABC-type cobalamin transport system permease subunit